MKTSSTSLKTTRFFDRLFPLSRQRRQALITALLVITDILAIGLAFWLGYQLRFVILPYEAPFSEQEYRGIVLGMLPIWLLIFTAFSLYNPQVWFGGLQEYAKAINAVLMGIVALIILGFLRREDLLISRGWLIISWFLATTLVIGFRFSFRRTVYLLRQRGHLLGAALMVGANAEGRALAEQLRDGKTSGLFITGFISEDLPIGAPVENGYKVLGGLDDLETLVRDKEIEEIIIAPTALSRDQLLSIYRTFNPNPNVTLRLSSGLFEVLNTGLRVKELAFVPLIELNQARITGLDAFIKWLLDFSLSSIGLIIISPILFLIGLAVRLDSPGAVIYRRRVMGANGAQFDAFKFRTMHANGDEILEAFPELRQKLNYEHKLKDDPRVTRVGKILRKYSLDELPQLVNVLIGQMSLVGPRMISPAEMEQYGKWGMNLLTVKPGISGLWQISGRSDVSYEERVRLDMYYIRNWTIWTDIYLLLATIPAVLRKKGAY